MGAPSHWVEHRRESDSELVGWVRPEENGMWTPIDLLGRVAGAPQSELTAGRRLDATGLAYLAERWELALEGGAIERVRIVEVNADRIIVKRDDYNAINAPQQLWTLPWPAPSVLKAI